ncbi:MAG: Hsp20 family protein [Bacteroidales bacterium]|nr:Hsp20 family protein [Bacteroidales bacterium]
MMYTMMPYRSHRLAQRPASLFDDRFFRSFFDMNDWMGNAGFRVDIHDNEKDYVIEAELPGVTEDQINLSVENDTLTISADMHSERTDEKAFVGFLDNFFRHLDVGVEFCPGNAFKIWLGYSYRQSKEMQAADITNMSGFSYGVGLRVKRINIGYARNNYHLGQAPNTISVSTNLENFLKH